MERPPQWEPSTNRSMLSTNNNTWSVKCNCSVRRLVQSRVNHLRLHSTSAWAVSNSAKESAAGPTHKAAPDQGQHLGRTSRSTLSDPPNTQVPPFRVRKALSSLPRSRNIQTRTGPSSVTLVAVTARTNLKILLGRRVRMASRITATVNSMVAGNRLFCPLYRSIQLCGTAENQAS